MSAFSWDTESNAGSESSSKVEFVKFPEGITRVRVIDEAPYQRWTHFMQKHKRSINCPGKGCPICDIRRAEKANKLPYSHAMAKRFSLNVINRETGRVEILEQGKTFIQDMKDIMSDLTEEQHTLLDADLKVRRRGMTKDDTTYRLDLDKTYPLSSEDEKLLEQRVDLQEYFKPHTPHQILRILAGEAWEDVMKAEEVVDADKHVDIEEEDIEIS